MESRNLSIKDAWNAVALEERLELLARAKAEGILAGTSCLLLLGAIAYGFDLIWLLAAGVAASLLVMPLFSSYSWRKNKPALILQYLAARSVARRYAYGYRILDLDVILIFRGKLEELFKSEEEKHLARQRESVDFDTDLRKQKDIWLCLLRGAVVVLSERKGGAKLEFITPILADTVVRKPKTQENLDERAIVVVGSGISKGRMVAITSSFPGALYVFEKQLARLIDETVVKKQMQESTRVADLAFTASVTP